MRRTVADALDRLGRESGGTRPVDEKRLEVTELGNVAVFHRHRDLEYADEEKVCLAGGGWITSEVTVTMQEVR